MNYTFQRSSGIFEKSPDQLPAIDLEQILAIAYRQWRLVAAAAIVALGFGVAYLLTATPIYTAEASLLIDTNNQKIVDQLSSSVASVLDDEAAILSQVELLKSKKIAMAVSDKLDLKDNPNFMSARKGLLGDLLSQVKGLIKTSGVLGGNSAPLTNEQIQQTIVEQLQTNLGVARVGRTYVLTLDYASSDPVLAQQIANAYAEAYLSDQLDSKYEATRRASEWLQQRITELRQKSLAADLAVQKFRTEKGLITTDGQLVSEQQLTQLNSQLIIAQTDTANAQAKYSRIKSIIASGAMESAVTESLESNVINELRTKFLDASRREADISNRLGRNHVQAVRLRSEMSEYRRLMFEELGRIAQSYQNNYEIALARQKSLEKQVADATGVSATANDAQVQLRELERESDTYKKLYETFLQRYQEAVQQQSFPVTEARVISSPDVPDKPSAPKKPLILALSMLLGLGVGSAFGALREFRDRFFRTGDQIRDILDLEPLGIVPYKKPALISPIGDPGARSHARIVRKSNSLANYVIEHPLSPFAETMRSAKIAIDAMVKDKSPKIVGFVSVLPGEGKSTVAINFAELLASQGSRVLLIDTDLKNPGATRQLGRHAEAGILEIFHDGMSTREVLMMNPETKLAFLPAVVKRRISYSSELLASDAMKKIIEDVAEAFDYIIFDLPPLAPVVDARAVSAKMDAYIFVVEWGKTSRSIVKKTLLNNVAVAQKCAGVILNKVDRKKMKLYHSSGSSEFYYSKYASYYQE